MHLSEQRESRGYMRKLDVTGIAHSFNLAHLSSTFRANSMNDVTATKKKKLPGSLSCSPFDAY